MTETRFWLIRHAIVEENARTIIYGTMDVELCPHSLAAQAPMYAALARRLPRPATWLASPLSRTQRTAAAIFGAGYPEQPVTIEPGLIELAFGEWQGLVHAALPARLTLPAHAFWPLGGDGAAAGRREHGRRHQPPRRRDGAAGGATMPARTWSRSAMAARSAPRSRTRCTSTPTPRCICRSRTSR